MAKQYDILVVGGGINGCGIARDAAGRGWSVLLCEMNDLASGTSSWSTKLVHGGLRYLEYYEFRLVREALMEREVLWSMAPHIIWPLRFVLPHHRGLRPAWLLRLGLFLYDHIGGRRKLPPTRTLDLRRDAAGRPLAGDYRRGFEYSDCWVDDARLVVLNARAAREKGAEIRTRTQVASLERYGEGWRVLLRTPDGGSETVHARLVVNAAGPWVDKVLGVATHATAHNVRLVQGSHIVVPKLFDHDRAYIFQNEDGRIVFAIPYERDFTLIGTTDRDYEGDPGSVRITDEEIEYLCRAAGEYFSRKVAPADVVWTYSGVRPLFDDGATAAQAATRDYVLKLDRGAGVPPLLNIFGGKITTYRRLAEAALQKIEEALGERRGRPWTAGATLPGGDFPADGYEALCDLVARDHPALPRDLVRRLVRAYGTDTSLLLNGVGSVADLGRDFGEGLTEREVEWLRAKEWASTAEDIVWRRSKLGLRMTIDQVAALEEYLQDRHPAREANLAAG
ncbi:glycerol-3-phosphate dehydrogenase [Lutibaculum baratangense]|uniref:glycerol-3-phosphate dehydrogenase n=1 Tax=Lutibaculum baratangense TaxID=1358440 RepID=UPI00058AC43C|nr:glycerol-3-phosphate dehydrogenase [Lutibaculum baratangense]